MNQEIKVKWVSALRSGDYIQGRNALKTADNKYCCLGVLCEVIGEEFISSKEIITNPNQLTLKNYNGQSSYLPRELIEKVELQYNQAAKLVTLNDLEKATFPEIATYIEENL